MRAAHSLALANPSRLRLTHVEGVTEKCPDSAWKDSLAGRFRKQQEAGVWQQRHKLRGRPGGCSPQENGQSCSSMGPEAAT